MDSAHPHVGSESPPLRSTILSSFLRGRPRGASQSAATFPNAIQDLNRDISPSPPSPGPGHRRRPVAVSSTASNPIAQTSVLSALAGPPTNPTLALSQMLRRRRSAGAVAGQPTVVVTGAAPNNLPPAMGRPTPSSSSSPAAHTHRIRLVPHLDSRRTLRFEPICRDLKDGDPALRIGRFTDRSGLGLAATNALGSNKLAFKSKVVSRAHAEIWAEGGGKFFIKDTKSSSGTFLNHVRLSPAGTESRPHQLKDGDILQLGVDYQGGTEDIYKSVKIRIEMGREWQSGANAFNTNALKQLKSLAVAPSVTVSSDPKSPMPRTNIPDCCICLFPVTIRQALFITPCSHTFHYKCIRPLLETHHPAFSCPLCRTFADLEEDVEIEATPEPDPTTDDHDETTGIQRVRDEAGAETEVEADARTPFARRSRVLSPPQLQATTESDEDAEMADVPVAVLGLADDDAEVDGGPRSLSASPDVLLVGGSGLRVHEDLSEGEGSGSGSGSGSQEADVIAIDADGSAEGGDMTVGAKRKR